METFPENFYRKNFITNPQTYPSSTHTDKYRQLLFKFVSENCDKLPNNIVYTFDQYVPEGISHKLTAELRDRGFKVQCIYNIFVDRIVMKIY